MTRKTGSCDCSVIHEEAVRTVLEQTPEGYPFAEIAAFYKILADETRCRIIFALQKQELCVCDLASLLSMTKSSVSHQLAKMRESGVVKCRRAGKEIFYSLDDDHVEGIFAATQAHILHREKERP